MNNRAQGAVRVVIAGAGIAGISAAVALKEQLGFTNFTIYEQGEDVGGTWRDNTYPGCSCDIAAHWYSLSTELNPNWPTYYVPQIEIHLYWKRVFSKHNLGANTKFRTKLHSATWNEERQQYNIILKDMHTGEESHSTADVLFCAMGGFSAPLYPKDISGRDTFKGQLWHSAEWRHDVELRGKRVGVIGNGASAVQFIPEISRDPSVEVVNFCRTPNWFVPRRHLQYPEWVKWTFANIPFVMRWYRNYIMARADTSFLIFNKQNTRIVSFARQRLEKYITHKAPKDELEKLIPKYLPGCKRVIVDSDYLTCLKQPNVSLNWGTIESVVEEGVKLKNGEVIPLDVLIFGTGYSLEPTDLRVRGRSTTIHQYFKTHGGPTAVYGMSIPGFPNVFVLLGPNTAVGHASVVFSEEAQVQYAIQMIKPIIDGRVKSFDIKEDVCSTYNSWLQLRLASSVWTDCRSYYHVNRDDHSKISAVFPGPVSLFWWMTRRPRWDHWNVVGAKTEDLHRHYGQGAIMGLVSLLVSLGVAFAFSIPQGLL
ncbi:FAD/NAD(P)-binding domain-containing protein [Guyanagaster necrorhizus]|uniref:FAD/NAD(P)-binding domain-containing protein n=1 Tax=Guyanagaster necrorhizus TaxID=856835 RepID=A0A9P7VVX3_9AGAR|nr:FAD/NAD(P)-binding domain-containing protein [Guyanagaster necrorhizus MCA 3950]KAG7447924.1 FAD/NAD(P)-binding domain-containing protein [Guyanagaster necrorhizus MCA 3950]